MITGKEYIKKLKKAYESCELLDQWNHLEEISFGIGEEDKQKLLSIYPDIPKALLEILEEIDGTYWRKYNNEEIAYYFFGSDVDDGEYPYYLFSTQQIIEQYDSASNFADLFYYYKEDPDNEYGLFVDDKIQMDPAQLKWLNFADCMNNGGTSSLYIDFTPSQKGIKGQIVRFLHDPDELCVIADSFEEFLQLSIDHDFAFIHEDDFDY